MPLGQTSCWPRLRSQDKICFGFCVVGHCTSYSQQTKPFTISGANAAYTGIYQNQKVLIKNEGCIRVTLGMQGLVICQWTFCNECVREDGFWEIVKKWIMLAPQWCIQDASLSILLNMMLIGLFQTFRGQRNSNPVTIACCLGY